MGMNLAGFRLLFAAIFCTCSGCATSPTGRKQLIFVSDSQMSQLGEQAFAETKRKMTVISDPHLNEVVQCVSRAIISITDSSPETWEVLIFNNPSVNAFALPGKKIGVHSGLFNITKTSPQLAAVIGHEVSHVTARHVHERVSESLAAQGGLALLDALLKKGEVSHNEGIMRALGLGYQFGRALPHSRRQEAEADSLGLTLMARAGFDPKGAVELWQNMMAVGGREPPEFLSDHPASSRRLHDLTEQLPEAERYYAAAAKKESVCGSLGI